MTTETHPPLTTPLSQPEPITRVALDSRIAAQGHELVELWGEEGASDEERAVYVTCRTCGATIDEDAESMDVDARLLVACQEPVWVSYAWEGDESEEEDL